MNCPLLILLRQGVKGVARSALAAALREAVLRGSLGFLLAFGLALSVVACQQPGAVK